MNWFTFKTTNVTKNSKTEREMFFGEGGGGRDEQKEQAHSCIHTQVSSAVLRSHNLYSSSSTV
jgi:hypothetical protein